jgi:XTP/dITP diphosphohydrolase
MKFHLASGNAHKAEEFRALVAASGLAVTVVSAAATGGMPPVEEDTGTFAGNARKKAQALRAKLPDDAWVLADDSGLCVDALEGAPGVESAYYAGPQGDGAANLAKLVAVMRDVPAAERGAHFVCVLLVLGPGGVEQVFEGLVGGRLEREPRGGAGFGYDPLFVPDGLAQTFAELPEAEKNRLSHRGRAWARLAEWVRQRSG